MSNDGYAQDGYFTTAATQFPITNSLTNTLLRDADASLYFMCQYFPGVLNLAIEPRWNACISSSGLSELDGYFINEVIPYDPWRFGLSQQNSWRFPMLAIFPTSTDYAFETKVWFKLIRQFELVFSLPPLNSEQYEQLFPFLQLVEKTIVDRTLMSYDSNFSDPLFPWKEAGLQQISIVGSSKYGNISYNTNLYLPTLMMKIQITERRMPNITGYLPLAGLDLEVSNDGYSLI